MISIIFSALYLSIGTLIAKAWYEAVGVNLLLRKDHQPGYFLISVIMMVVLILVGPVLLFMSLTYEAFENYRPRL